MQGENSNEKQFRKTIENAIKIICNTHAHHHTKSSKFFIQVVVDQAFCCLAVFLLPLE